MNTREEIDEAIKLQMIGECTDKGIEVPEDQCCKKMFKLLAKKKWHAWV
jgi:hypothetical protein